MMFVIAHNRREGSSSVHFLPEGGVIQMDENTLLARMGNTVIVQTGRDKYTIDAPGSLNMTEKVLHFVPFEAMLNTEGENAIEHLRRLEEIAWSEEMPNEVRRFIRTFAALYGLRILDNVPISYKESVALTVSRLTGEPIGKLISGKNEIERKLERELHALLRTMRPEYMNQAINTVIAV